MHARFSLYYSLRRFGSMLRLPVFVLVAFSLSGCLGSAPANEPTTTPKRPTATPKPAANGPTATPAPAAPAEWTVLVYLDGDNDLETEALADYAEMATVGSSAAVNIVVQFDRISSNEDWDDSSNGDWRGVKRFRVERNKKPVKGNQLADLGELDMGSPRTLADFASWGIATYPARHYALIFWDHGASWPGVASDDTSDGDMLTLPELAKALADVQKRTGVSKLDLIGFDACLMSQLDVFQAIAPFGKIAIGSADLEPGEGWAWNAWLRELANQPPQRVAAPIAETIEADRDQRNLRQECIDLFRVCVGFQQQADTLPLAVQCRREAGVQRQRQNLPRATGRAIDQGCVVAGQHLPVVANALPFLNQVHACSPVPGTAPP